MPSSRTLWMILLLAFCLRLAGAAYWHSRASAEGTLFRLGDSHGYWVLAGHIARGEAYQYGSPNARVFRAPLYPIVLAPFTLISEGSNGVFAARVFGSALGTLAVFQLMLLAGNVGGRQGAIYAGLIGAVSPAAIGMSVAVLSEMLLVPLMLAQLWLWQAAWRAPDWRHIAGWAVLAGLAAGAATLARPSWLLFTPFLLAVGVIAGPKRQRHAAIGLVSILMMCACMLPWWVRNGVVTGKFVPTTLQVGPSLYDGLHPGASGGSDEGMAFMQSITAAQIAADQRAATTPEGTLEYRVNRRAQRLALQFARENPAEVIRLAAAKFRRTWSFWPRGNEVGSTPIRLALTLATFGVMMLAIYGSWTFRRLSSWWIAVCWMPCLYFTLLHMLFVGSIRYREPAVFVLAAVAGCAIAEIAGRRNRTNRSAPRHYATASESSR